MSVAYYECSKFTNVSHNLQAKHRVFEIIYSLLYIVCRTWRDEVIFTIDRNFNNNNKLILPLISFIVFN